MEYPCILIRLHEDGKVEVDNDLFLNYHEEELPIPNMGYMTLVWEKASYTDIYVVARTMGQAQTYLEGFLIGRNLDYIPRNLISSSIDYQKIVQQSYNKLRIKE